MSKAETRIAYTGPALEDGVMDVRELAPALLALGEACTSAHEILTGQEKRVSVRVRSDFRSGSFEFTVEVVELWQRLSHVLTGSDYATAKELIWLLGIGVSTVSGASWGLLTLIKKLRGRKPKSVVELEDGNVSLTLEDGEKIIVPKNVLKLHNSSAVRKAVKKVMAPLETDGIDGLEVRDPEHRDKVVERIDQKDAPYYTEISDLGEVTENETELLLQPVTVHLEGERQWVFRRGEDWGDTLRAKIIDEDFVRKMRTGEVSFRRGDTIRARVRERQWEEGGNLKVKNEIIQILDYREAGK